jgi:hypothetical protein
MYEVVLSAEAQKIYADETVRDFAKYRLAELEK